jgi:hypothetical protein
MLEAGAGLDGRRGVVRLLLIGCLLGASPAAAQESPTNAEARVHFNRAVALFESGDARGALAEFQRAYELSGRASVLYNIGASYQALYDYPQAIEVLRRFLAAEGGRPGPQRELAGRALRQMEPLVAQLRVMRSPSEATVSVDGRAVAGDRVTLGPGTHVVSASAPGHESREIPVTLVSGDDREVQLSLTPVAPAIVPVPAAALPPPAASVAVPGPVLVRPGPTVVTPPSRLPFWSAVVTGGALALGASITGALAVATQHDYAARHMDDPAAAGLASRGRALALTADLLGLGALGVGTVALVLGLQARGRPAPSPIAVVIGPVAGGVSLVGFGAF